MLFPEGASRVLLLIVGRNQTYRDKGEDGENGNRKEETTISTCDLAATLAPTKCFLEMLMPKVYCKTSEDF